MKKRPLIKDAAQFTISGYIASICNFISAVIVRRILDPFFMGIYAELSLIFDYAKYNHLGMIDSLDRQIPYYNGRKEFNKTEEVKNAGISFALFTSLFASLIIIVFSYIFKDRLSPSLSLGLKVIAVMVVIQSMSSFYVTLVRTHHLFDYLSRYVILVAICDIAFKAFLGIRFGVIGILWATVFTLIIGIAYLFRKTGLRFRVAFRIPKRLVKLLLGIGFPLLLAGFTFMVLRSVDRIMIIAFLSKEELGYYSIAVMMHSFVFQLPNLIYTVLFPRFYEVFGSSENDIRKLKDYLEKPTLAFAYLFPIFIGLTVMILPLFVNYILPKYISGITPAAILLFGTFFISITNMSGYLLIALKKQKNLVLIGAICIAISTLLNLIFIKILHLGIKGVALGTACTYFLYSIFLIVPTIKHYIEGFNRRFKFFVSLYIPLLWVLAITYICNHLFSYDFSNLKWDVANVSLRMLVFLALAFPLLVFANKKIDLYTRIKNAGLNIFKK